MDRHFNGRDVAVSLGIGYVLYKVLVTLCRWPLFFLAIWGLIALLCWLTGMDGWEAFLGFLGLVAILLILACGALLIGGHGVAAVFLFIVGGLILSAIGDPTHCVGNFCYHVHSSAANDIETPYGWVSALPPGGMDALPVYHPEPGLFEKAGVLLQDVWTWIANKLSDRETRIIVAATIVSIIGNIAWASRKERQKKAVSGVPNRLLLPPPSRL